MEKINLQLELVTPMFLNAARSSGPPVLRAAPFRGVLRYWLRALAPCYLQPLTQPKLKAFESAVFGNTQVGSAISIDVEKGRNFSINDCINMLPYRVLLPLPKRNKPLPSPGFTNGGNITIRLRGRVGLPIPVEGLKALLLWLNLGGVGKRARRGFGSLQCIGVSPENALPEQPGSYFWPDLPENGQKLADRIFSTLEYCLGRNGGGAIQKCAPPNALPPATGFTQGEYPNFGKGQWIVVIGSTPFKTYQSAMTDFFIYRLAGNRGNPAFGSANRRFASPLHVHIAKTNQDYHLVFTAFFAKPTGLPQWEIIHKLMSDCLIIYNGEAYYSK